MKYFLVFLFLLTSCKKNDSFYLKAVVRNAECSRSLFETKCESNVKIIEQPLEGEHCSPNGLAGAVGDTILIKLEVLDSMTVKCLLPWR